MELLIHCTLLYVILHTCEIKQWCVSGGDMATSLCNKRSDHWQQTRDYMQWNQWWLLLEFSCFSSLRSPLQPKVRYHFLYKCILYNNAAFPLTIALLSRSFADSCQFCYTKWPSSKTLDCSPYKGDEDLAIECTAEGPASLEINWFYNDSSAPSRNDSEPLRNDSNYFIQTIYTTGTRRIRSRLRVRNVTAGNYWCQVYHNNAGVYPASQVLSIADSSSYSRLRACEVASPQSEGLPIPKCHPLVCNTAGVLPTTTTTTVTTITTTRPPPLITTTPATPGITTATPGITTATPTSGNMVVLNSRGHSSIRVLPTRTSYPTPTPQESLQDVPEPYQTWLFVVVALTAVFGMLIIILTIVCIGICILRSRSNEVDCEKGLSKDICMLHTCKIHCKSPCMHYTFDMYDFKHAPCTNACIYHWSEGLLLHTNSLYLNATIHVNLQLFCLICTCGSFS